jgi:hypothetical protein
MTEDNAAAAVAVMVSSTTSSTSSHHTRLSPFWLTNSLYWIAAAEGHFFLDSTTEELKRHYLALAALPEWTLLPIS